MKINESKNLGLLISQSIVSQFPNSEGISVISAHN